jgi:hypothetical protein
MWMLQIISMKTRKLALSCRDISLQYLWTYFQKDAQNYVTCAILLWHQNVTEHILTPNIFEDIYEKSEKN